MWLKRQIPNLFTMSNLACGCMAVVVILKFQDPFLAAFLALFALIFDFFDGFLARLLKVSGELGKQLDSLADMVTFGILPGVVVFDLLGSNNWYAWIALVLIPIFSAYRLGKFNLDTRQSENFIGMPTPANAAFWIPLPLIVIQASHESQRIVSNWPTNNPDKWLSMAHENFISELILNPAFLLIMTGVMCFFMVSEISMFSLKFKNLSWKDNKIRFVFILLTIATIATSIIVLENLFLGLPIVILLYLLISIVNSLSHKNEVQS